MLREWCFFWNAWQFLIYENLSFWFSTELNDKFLVQGHDNFHVTAIFISL